jgi:hypothetical protein
MRALSVLCCFILLTLLAGCSSSDEPLTEPAPSQDGKVASGGDYAAIPDRFLGAWRPQSATAGARGIEISRKGFIREWRPAPVGVTQTGMTDIRVIKSTPTEIWLIGRTPYASGNGAIVTPQKLYLSPGGQLTYTIGGYCGLTENEWKAKDTKSLVARQGRFDNCRFESLFGRESSYIR